MKNETNISEEVKFDNRLIKRLIREGKIDKQEYETYLKGLPDEENNVNYIDVYEEKPIEEPTPLATEALTFTSG
ncbi:MAG: hypothetical protein HN337_06690 [Deltaproteobacteria bacterium]|nr:hypothetical protein [Deltaproteobacteria bacterium]